MTATLVRNIALCAVLVLGGCSTRSATLPSAPARAQTAPVTFVIQIPQNTSAKQRRPAFLSGFTKSVSVTITGPSGPPTGPFVGNCSSGGFCSQMVDAPIGQDTFAVSLYDGLNATGLLLSSGSATATIAAGQSNTVTVTFNPVVGQVVIVQSATVKVGMASSIPLMLVAQDPRGASIVGPGNFEKPDGSPTTLSVTLNDPSGHFALQGTTSYTAPPPAGVLSLTYDGALLKFDYPQQLNVLQDGTPIRTTPVRIEPGPVGSFALLPAGVNATSLAEGPDGNVWFTAQNPNGGAEAGRFAIASATVSHYPLADGNANPNLATAGGDGNVWFFEQNRTRFASISPTGALQEYNATFQVSSMTKGTDGNVWFLTSQTPTQIGKITPAGTITTYALPNDGIEPETIAAASGRLWMIATTVGGSATRALASIATDGTGYTTTPIAITPGLFHAASLYFGGDGNFYLGWDTGTPQYLLAVRRITPSGVVTDLCSAGSHNSIIGTTKFDDGTIVFGTFNGTLSNDSLIAILPTGACRVAAFQFGNSILGRMISGGGDGWLYVYGNQTLTKYGY